ncbi:DUF6346 domain-containing protein [Actinoplanes sp. RD1]|uniref:DUF6346 domain-containing protein n=1 Tax=Actinoplanes sp. RD1 TaxID=3064538 RepID=UPI002740646E|nr:DUF6346 domain-containing protein [Actinoplanes sp. RD1]
MKKLVLSLVLLILGGVLAFLVPTVARTSQPDFADAKRTGTGTSYVCVEQGPLTLGGFGYTSKCTVRVTWDDGTTETVDPDRYGFAESGERFTIGELENGTFARPDRPFRVGAVVGSWVLGVLAAGALVGGLVAGVVFVRRHVNFT